MRKTSTLALFSILLANPFQMQAQEWKLVKEGKYNSANVLVNEKTIGYNRQNRPTIQNVEYNNETKVRDYDDAGNLIREEYRRYDEYGQAWSIITRDTYSYNEADQVLNYKKYYGSVDQTMVITANIEYEYNDLGYLSKVRTYGNEEKDMMLLFVEYVDFNEAGKPLRKNSYNSEEETVLSDYSEYLYDHNDNLTLETVYSRSIASNKIELSYKYAWTYNETGKVEQYQTYRWNPIENTLSNEYRTDYIYDATTGNLSSEVFYYWSNDNSNWNKSYTLRYTYSDQLNAQKAPQNLGAQLEDNTYLLSWEAPAYKEGLTGYNIYNGFMLVDHVSASNLNYTITSTPAGLSPVYVAAVYGNAEGNITEYIELEELSDDEVEYPAPSLGGISYINQYGMGNMDIEVYWSAPETDKEFEGYHVYFNGWQQNDKPLTETVYRFTLMRAVASGTIGISALYKDGMESAQDEKLFDFESLLAGITESAIGKEIWAYANTICIKGETIRSVEIFDASGMKVVSKELNGGINVIRMPANIYIVRAVTGQGVITKKVTVK